MEVGQGPNGAVAPKEKKNIIMFTLLDRRGVVNGVKHSPEYNLFLLAWSIDFYSLELFPNI
jgi:hypothetical protein